MNSKDCGVTATGECIAALIVVVLLFHIHCHMALTVLEISHSLANQVRVSFNLPNFAWSPLAICLIRCSILSIDVLLRCLVLALEDGRRGSGLSMEKRERRDGGFAKEKMERRGGGFAMEKRERRDGGFRMEKMERREDGFAMEKSERSVPQRFTGLNERAGAL